jgi:hypothetical protein
MARALSTYVPWFGEQARKVIPDIRRLRKAISRKFTKKLLATLQEEGFLVKDKNSLKELLEEKLEWLRWLRKTHSWLVGQVYKEKKK